MLISQIIEEVDTELPLYYQAEAFLWARQRGETEYSVAIDQFHASVGSDEKTMKAAAIYYRDVLVDLFKRYKTAMGVDERTLFLEQL